MAFLEIACFNADSALVASKAGADRIEFCASPEVGGTTPDLEVLRNIRDQIAIPVFVMIRPRGGGFDYTDAEFQQMRDSVAYFKGIANGFVFGLLDANSRVDVPRTTELVTLARPLPCTFHRAFDSAMDLYQALEAAILCGISAVLTSGGAPSAIEGRDVLAELVQMARGRIDVMPGGGVRSTNIDDLVTSTHASFYHSSALVDDEKIASFTEILRLKTSCTCDRESS